MDLYGNVNNNNLTKFEFPDILLIYLEKYFLRKSILNGIYKCSAKIEVESKRLLGSEEKDYRMLKFDITFTVTLISIAILYFLIK